MTEDQRHDAYWRVVAAMLPIAIQITTRPKASGLVQNANGQQAMVAELQPLEAVRIALKVATMAVHEHEVGT